MNKKIKKWESLYKKSKKDKISKWSIWVQIDEYPTIYRKSGFIGFKQRITKKVIKKGTNIGKSNEKTPLENAIFIADRYWDNHIKDNYVQNVDNINDTPLYIKPMLAKSYKKPINDNVIVQPKYNGIRCFSLLHLNDDRLLSRERNEFPCLTHIKDRISDIFGKYSPDGEIYHHDLTFQEIVRRTKKYREGLTESLKYYVYDIAVPDIPFKDRKDILDSLIPDNDPIIKKVSSYDVKSHEEILKYHNSFVKDGYEGVIIRYPDSYYMFNDRPTYLQKYKEFIDEEFVIVGFEKEEWDDNGIIKDLVMWICSTKEGETFNVRLKGSFDRRIELYKKAKDFLGKFLTVRYQETSENGTPIFGVGIEIRDYE